ncbi:MAG: XdhC family protein [Litoreibacter sp.]|uniref:XdhC family protein n=1 Tax=Litoreibacter sp. TaxID=1969459 RepID=UPI0032975647
MTPREITDHGLQEGEDCFAIATIVRTAGTTSAKPGAKALLHDDGTILDGWLGGGCVRGAVRDATLRAYATGQPQLISVAPEEELAEKGVAAGDDMDGIRFARNGCPSKGSIDIFIEPYLPAPELVVFGTSNVGVRLVELAPQFGWAVVNAAPDDVLQPKQNGRARYLVIATQGTGDIAALTSALGSDPDYVSFVGSKKKFASLSTKLVATGLDADAVASIKAPSGLDIGAVTPAEIALSILAELVEAKRRILAKAAQNG